MRWDWIAPTAAALVLLELFNLWWKWHGFTGSTLGEVMPYFGVLLLLYLAASASLPDEVPAEGLDLKCFAAQSHRYFWSPQRFWRFSPLMLPETSCPGFGWRSLMPTTPMIPSPITPSLMKLKMKKPTSISFATVAL